MLLCLRFALPQPRVLVAQSSALMRDVAPLSTVKQWLKRWQGEHMTPAQVMQRVLQDAGLSRRTGTPRTPRGRDKDDPAHH